MNRTTIFLDEQLEREVHALARRSGRSTAAVVREALEQYVVATRTARGERLGFVAAGRSGRHDTAERHEELLWDEASHPSSPAAADAKGGQKRAGTPAGISPRHRRGSP